ncbi:MAG: TonB-dependent receptor [Desulfobacterales bacterium]|nr:TonB-dependent receptor [Desulfobacterales bacterium]
MKTKELLAAAFMIFLVQTPMARGEETSAAKEAPVMGEVVVTATRTAREVEKIPARTAVITAEDIDKSGAHTVPDALRMLPGVFVSDLNGNGVNQTVDIGGFGATSDRHVAVVVDGRRINPIDLGGVRWSTVPIESVDRIEVLYGSGSVLYGDNAVGGVINIITKEVGEGIGSDVEAAGGSLSTHKVRAGFNAAGESAGIHVSANRYRSDGYRERSEVQRKNLYGKFRADLSDSVVLSGDASVNDASYEFPGALTQAQLAEDRRQAANFNDEGADETISGNFSLDTDFAEFGALNLTVGLQNQNSSSDLASWFSYVMFDVETVNANAKHVLDSQLAGRENRLTLGVDYYDTDYEAFRDFFKGGTANRYDHRKQTLSVYIQDELELFDDLFLNAGARLEQPDIELTTDIGGAFTRKEIDDSETAWNVGLSYAFMPNSKIYGRVYRSFRYPVVDEYTNLFTGAVNDQLKQETALGYEAGVRLALTHALTANVRAFMMNVEDEIAWSNATNQNENLDKTRHSGGQLDVAYRPLDRLTIFGNVGYTEAEFTEGVNDGKSVPLVPDWKGKAGVEITPTDNLRFRLTYNYVGERYFGDDNGNVQEPMESYSTVDAYVSYLYKNIEIFMNGSNIFAEEYSDVGYYRFWIPDVTYYPMPEAVYYGGIRVSF